MSLNFNVLCSVSYFKIIIFIFLKRIQQKRKVAHILNSIWHIRCNTVEASETSCSRCVRIKKEFLVFTTKNRFLFSLLGWLLNKDVLCLWNKQTLLYGCYHTAELLSILFSFLVFHLCTAVTRRAAACASIYDDKMNHETRRVIHFADRTSCIACTVLHLMHKTEYYRAQGLIRF